MRFMLAGVIAWLDSGDAMIAGLDLIHDQANPAVPHELRQGIKNVFRERRPAHESVGSGRPPNVSMMPATDFGHRHDRAQR